MHAAVAVAFRGWDTGTASAVTPAPATRYRIYLELLVR
jgi:hypothetical protein